jgi:hypothetical protein
VDAAGGSGVQKTLARDLAELELVLDLIKRTPKGFVANREVILAFLPWRKGAPSEGKAG